MMCPDQKMFKFLHLASITLVSCQSLPFPSHTKPCSVPWMCQYIFMIMGFYTYCFSSFSVGKESAKKKKKKRICLPWRRPEFHSWVRKIPWRREWLPAPVFFPGEFHGQRSLVSYSPWGRKESDMTEPLTHTHACCYPGTIFPLLHQMS